MRQMLVLGVMVRKRCTIEHLLQMSITETLYRMSFGIGVVNGTWPLT